MALTRIKTDGITDGSILNADINASAAVALSKLSTSGTASGSTYLRGDGAWSTVPSADPSVGIDFNDNVKARWGTGNDLEIYHTGAQANIRAATGQGSLWLTGDQIELINGAVSENMLIATQNAAVKLYYDNSLKLETTSAGAKLSGNLAINNSTQSKIVLDTSDGSDSKWLNINGGGDASQSRGGGVMFAGNEYTSNEGRVWLLAGNSGSANGTIDFSTGGSLRARLTHDGHFTIPNDSSILKLGASNDLQIYHDGSNSFLKDTTGDIIIRSADDVYIQPQNGDLGVSVIGDGAVEIYYDNAKKLETTNDGIKVSGARSDFLGSGQQTFVVGSSTGAGAYVVLDGDSNGDAVGSDYSYIAHKADGHVEISCDNPANNASFYLKVADGTENALYAQANGKVELMHNGLSKLETTSDGVKFTGVEYLTEGTIYLEKGGAHHHRILINDQGNDLAFQQSSDSGANTNFTSYLRMKDGGDIWLPVDATKLLLGASEDLQIYHDGHSRIKTSSSAAGNLVIDSNNDINLRVNNSEMAVHCHENAAVELYYDNSKKFETHTDGIHVTGDVSITGNYLADDNEKIKMGDGADLQIYHDGNNSTIKDSSAGWLQLLGEKVKLANSDGSETFLQVERDGGVKLYHNNVLTFNTESTGIELRGPESGNCELYMYADEGDDNADLWKFVADVNGGFSVQNKTSGSWENSITAIGNGATDLWYDNSKKFETLNNGVKSGGRVWVTDGNSFVAGDGDDLKIFHDGNNSYVQDFGTGFLGLQGSEVRVRNNSGHPQIVCSNDVVELWYDNAKKCETTTNGFSISANNDIRFNNGNWTGNSATKIQYHDSALYVVGGTNGVRIRSYNGSRQIEMNNDGHFRPANSNTQDLGDSSYRWRNLYTNDLNLSNEGSANEVDGTWGDYTIQEGESDLFLLNRRNGKKYKFNVTEVN